jgi:hypothetical protein
VLAFGHPLFNLGPVDMPLAKSEVVLTLASQFQPEQDGQCHGSGGRARQDRHSGIMGELGATSPMIRQPESAVAGRQRGGCAREGFHFNVFDTRSGRPR